uniref:Neuroepithelial cell-transforming gene 1 protein-like n=1 Tax=Sinocyclocheilus anshuiensis TaxID=1608454 RepID=A0A671NHV6_9TELE
MVAYDEPCVVPIKRTLQKIDYQNQTYKELEEPCTKRVRPLGRVTSLANLISPVKNGAVRRFGQTLQASFRGDGRSPGVPQQKPCSKAVAPTPPKRRNSTLWSETLDVHQKGTFSTKEIKRQEVSTKPRLLNPLSVPLPDATESGLCDLLNLKGLGLGKRAVPPLTLFSFCLSLPLSLALFFCRVLLAHSGMERRKSGCILKLHVFLFTEVLVLTRPVTRNDRHCFQVYRQPIPVQDLVLEDLQDGDVRMGGSFRGAFSNADKAKNIFRVRFQDPSQGQSHTLQVNDIFHKQQWLNCLRAAMSTQKDSNDICTKRRSSSVSAIIHMEETDENCPRAAASAPSSPSSEEPPSPTPSATSTLSSSSSSSSISAPFQPRKSKKDKRSICSLGKRKETMV